MAWLGLAFVLSLACIFPTQGLFQRSGAHVPTGTICQNTWLGSSINDVISRFRTSPSSLILLRFDFALGLDSGHPVASDGPMCFLPNCRLQPPCPPCNLDCSLLSHVARRPPSESSVNSAFLSAFPVEYLPCCERLRTVGHSLLNLYCPFSCYCVPSRQNLVIAF